MRIAIFCPNLIGDTVMATPTLRAIRRGYPEAELVGVMKASVEPVLRGTTWFDQTLQYRPRGENPDERFWGVIERLKAHPVDLAVLLPNSMRSGLMAKLGGARRIVGYARGGRGWLLSDRLYAPLDEEGRFLPTPAVSYYLAIARHLGCPVDHTRLELATTEDEEREADRVWENLRLGPGTNVVCLNTGGAFGPAKNWPNEHFASLSRRLATELDVRVLVLCGPAERENARAIVESAGMPGVTSLADQAVSLGLSKACLRRSALLVTTDSGPRHIATAFGIPVVTLFGPTHIAWTRTHHPRALQLQVPVPCGPCQKPTCGEGHHRCMRELEPSAVFAAVARLLHVESRSRSPLGGRTERLGDPSLDTSSLVAPRTRALDQEPALS